MKLNDDTMEACGGGFNTSFGYSATKLDELGASEYTLVTIVVDKSGSVGGFQSPMEACIKEAVKACKLSPRADNLMIRVVFFNGTLEEIHGYKLLQNCNPDDYNGILQTYGGTALFDATKTSIDATVDYAKTLGDNDFGVNAIVIVITDGDDNSSTYSAAECQKSVQAAIQSEVLESIRTILIGVNTSNGWVKDYLKKFKDEANIDQYEDVATADSKTLAKLADFISKSISAQSQSLGTGGPSQQISLSI